MTVYSMFQPKMHIIPNPEEIDYTVMRRNIIAIDYGSDRKTAILLISKTRENAYVVTRSIRPNKTAVSDITNLVSRLYQEFISLGAPIDALYVDPSAKALKEEFDKNGIPYENAVNAHNIGIPKIANMLSLNRLFILETCEDLINEIYGYRRKNENSDEVVKVNDHFCDALRYGVTTDEIRNA